MKLKLSLLLFSFCTILFAQENKNNEKSKDSIQKLDEVIINSNVIFGSKYVAKNRTGSAYYISPEELKKYNYTDINRVLRSVPGVTFYEEDGFGLRPNISLRGTSPQRSAKISIMEDGVLIAPAPYSSPSAYYFPSVARMEAVEILKGSSQVQYGPFTTGGAINMVSAQIPDEFGGRILANYGAFNTRQLHAKAGGQKGQFGYVAEFLNFGSSGFKDLPDDSHTGFDINELLAKLRYSSKADAKIQQYIEAKFQYSDEVSNETYLGLTEEDFETAPFSRYASSQDDQMVAEHMQFMLTHELNLTKNFRITTNAYLNKFKRNWFKLDDVVFNGDKQGIANVVANPTVFPDHMAIVRGDINSGADALLLKANNREYYSTGVQTKLDYHWYGENTFHDLEVGARYHYDEEDRFQWEDGYSIIDGQLDRTSEGPRGAQGNRISSATAFAAYAMYKLKWNDLTLTPGLRYENILLEREDFGSSDPTRAGDNLSTRENKVDIFIPGIGFNYAFTDNVSVFGGVHKGFSPPGNSTGEEAEESINYEIGSRFTIGKLRGELVGFYNDYSNLLGSDIAATGGTGNLDQFNAGEVEVSGVELLLNYELLPNNSTFKLPISFGYTFTHTEFLNAFDSANGIWGEVEVGDELPYIPKHQFNAAISLEHTKYELNLSGRYNGEFRSLAGNGSIPDAERVDSNFIIDFSAKYHFNKKLSLTSNIINLLDETYAVSRVPAGLRPGHPFGANLGLEFKF
ncbi:TonB-dependent receptor family protein [Winogradskyella jejuensis]|uniref:Fe(3+) dicitrate transport protein n=1 Tax=Winogradskyella jejuensis TaxID=1089305 RepID=A0A1M5JK45_9FLAO|nr:TonB-dependent receptor [Winogradskyella jejuensis]SHG40640.1 Fe(3+) dicitrate transport protein [Winogradskyella jejuensis]